jgi:hypothetical protein
MARILIVSTHGSEDPTRAGVAFIMAKGAVERVTSRRYCLPGTQRSWQERWSLKAYCPWVYRPLRSWHNSLSNIACLFTREGFAARPVGSRTKIFGG